MRTFYLHIGHGKTGSSMLQSGFWLSREVLKANDIRYPQEQGRKGLDERKITSGNGGGLVSTPKRLNAALKKIGDSHHVLFSSESLFFEMAQSNELPDFVQQITGFGFDRVCILLFVRDPMGHAASSWQQRVKRSGKHITIEEHFQEYRLPRFVAELMKKIENIPNVELTIRNYSVCRNTLFAEAEAWLGLSSGSLLAPKAERINRSMTRSELEFQLAFNRVLGKCGDLISDPLCEKLTEIVPDDIRPSEEVQAAMWERLLPQIEIINRYLPADHAYRRDIKAPSNEDGLLSFTPEQIEVIVGSICERFTQHRAVQQKLATYMEQEQSK